MATVKVEKMEWNVEHVAAFASESDFVTHYTGDVDVYPRRANKSEILSLVYKACTPEKPKTGKKSAEVKE